MRFGTWNDESL